MNTVEYPEYSIFDKDKFEQKSLRFKDNFFPGFLTPSYGSWSDYHKLLIKEAYRMATEAHVGQKRKSKEAYVTHIEDVLFRAKRQSKTIDISLTPDDIIVALLHDTLEDHPEYFDEIYKKFGYTILVRVLGLSKPSKELYAKWKGIADREKQETAPYQAELYRFWTIVVANWDNQNLEERMTMVNRPVYKKYSQDNNVPSDILPEINRINGVYKSMLEAIESLPEATPEQKEGKSKLFSKRWQEYTAELQIFLNPKENFKIKLADKTANLGDIAFHTRGESIQKKSDSILKNTKSYHWLTIYHKLEKLIPEFTQLETKFRASLAVHSPVS